VEAYGLLIAGVASKSNKSLCETAVIAVVWLTQNDLQKPEIGCINLFECFAGIRITGG
jgi:hypothetical protein